MSPPAIKRLRRGRLEVSSGFLLLMAWLNYTDTQGLFAMTVLACFAHELGHCCAIALLGGHVASVRLTVTGAELRLQRGLSYLREMFCAFAGPLVNLVLAMVGGNMREEQWLVFAGINLSLGLFNLLPIGGLDGGRILRCLLALLLRGNGVEQIGPVFDCVLTVMVLVTGIWVFALGGSITLVLIGVWLGVSIVRNGHLN